MMHLMFDLCNKKFISLRKLLHLVISSVSIDSLNLKRSILRAQSLWHFLTIIFTCLVNTCISGLISEQAKYLWRMHYLRDFTVCFFLVTFYLFSLYKLADIFKIFTQMLQVTDNISYPTAHLHNVKAHWNVPQLAH